ncbi:MAG TPA: hypothetical protein VNQ73_14790 [Ilumatobacter sp.]|nr:hypothetical protein [Ilumatobacter sp.]
MRPDRLDPAPLVAVSRLGVRGLARVLEVNPAVLCRPISAWQADRWAVRMGWLPHEVWDDDWWGCTGGYEPEEPASPAELAELVAELIRFGHRAAAAGRQDEAARWYERAMFVDIDADAEGIDITGLSPA